MLDMDHSLYKRLNKELVSMSEVTDKYDIAKLEEVLTQHVRETGSDLGRDILEHFRERLPFFKKVIPNDYQRMLSAIGHFEEQGISHDDAELEAFKVITEGK